MTKRKWYGEERRNKILSMLKEREAPQTGGALAEELNVSRQVIVQDISLLKAKNIPIIATNHGYILSEKPSKQEPLTRIVACYHPPERTEEELFLLVDHGITVRDVKVEHPIYGDITASVMVSNRKEVKLFIENIITTKASYLSELTDGIHLHTLEAKSEEDLDDGILALDKAGFLLKDHT
ncbi:transcription repressor NadR [Evansella cellulosilytica]|uniref:3H domain-containing protein n=1 Tax=Evansella cellulosilytica (strain ATCC 21833 / DSM 2522 / FERM P-1141 / JCM 9156 / N-4) TaxID=649639 RepID=E6TUE1_EVAC2|nr:transcription repressor NadR [Evansella cellulosilytica]ADU29697.1 3H domain-containing protein [Evansella cellulosilytica DSM 2522]